MDEKELDFIIQEGEGQFIEFKENIDKSLAKEIVAFANSQGGRIFLGITDSGVIKGVQVTNRLKATVLDIARNCDPSINLHLEQFEDILILGVEEGTNKPYACSQGFYLRIGAHAPKLSRDEIINFSIEEGKIKFDEQINKDFNFSTDFDAEKFTQYIKLAELTQNIPVKDILITLKVARIIKNELKFTNAGVLFFAKDPSKFFMSSKVVCVNYQTNEKVHILDKKIFDNGIINNIQDAIAYAKKHIDVKYEIKTAKRKEIPQYPEESYRESIVNAVMHRDYFETSGDVMIDIFKNKIMISNPGGLVKWMKPEEFGTVSRPRNQIIAELLSKTIYVEKLGTGINRIKNAMKEAGLPAPEFKYSFSFFTTLFDITGGEGKIEGGQIGGLESGQIGGHILTERQKEIIAIIKNNPRITRIELSQKLKINPSAIQKHLVSLKKVRLIKRVGSAKSGYWEITLREENKKGKDDNKGEGEDDE